MSIGHFVAHVEFHLGKRSLKAMTKKQFAAFCRSDANCVTAVIQGDGYPAAVRLDSDRPSMQPVSAFVAMRYIDRCWSERVGGLLGYRENRWRAVK